MKGVLAPFLKIGHVKTWSLLSIFGAQSWSEDEQSAELARYEEIIEEKREQYAKQVRALYGAYMKQMLIFAENRESWTLAQWLEHIEQHETLSLHERHLYDFLMLCHQRAPLQQHSQTTDEQSMHLLAEATQLLGDRQLIIEELPEILQATSRFKIQNMQFNWLEDE